MASTRPCKSTASWGRSWWTALSTSPASTSSSPNRRRRVPTHKEGRMATKYVLGLRLLAMKFVSYLVALGPMPVRMGGIRYWVDPTTGRLMPAAVGAEGEGEGEGGGEGEGEGRGSGEGEGSGDGEGEREEAGEGEPDWKAESRKHEKRSKAERKRADELEARLKKIEESNQTDQEKAIQKAKEEAKAEAHTEAEQSRRDDRLEVAVTRLANKGVKVKVDGKDEVSKFADSDDALVWIQKGIKSGDLDPD